ncbi:MAG: hypothetical protein A2144_01800 [Chloroflexi bacterium RBG_16_50_9]|nr:MAG: hypothetical protein A2144_01800 [Chloroflexi bacterium RBG_16_50_9]
MTQRKKKPTELSLNLDLSGMTDAEYKKLWDLCRIEIRCVEKIGECQHNVGDIYVYESPYKRPSDVCYALLHVLELYTWRVALGYPSWNAEDRGVYRIHCPDSTGTVWEMRKLR